MEFRKKIQRKYKERWKGGLFKNHLASKLNDYNLKNINQTLIKQDVMFLSKRIT